MKDHYNSMDVNFVFANHVNFVSHEFFFCVFFSILHLTSSRNIVFIANKLQLPLKVIDLLQYLGSKICSSNETVSTKLAHIYMNFSRT